MKTEEVHLFDNGVKVFKKHLLPVQLDRYAIRNVHEAEEEDIFVELIRNMPPQGVYVNIGSAVGYYALLARKLRPDIRIIAIEPLDIHRNYFLENIKLNGFHVDNFEILDCAVSSVNGEVDYFSNSYGSMISKKQSCPVGTCETVPSRTLDSIAIEIKDKIDLCQMDVQGAEADVLASAANVIMKRGVMSFLIGTHGESLHNKCIEILKNAGFQANIDNCFTTQQPDGIICATLPV